MKTWFESSFMHFESDVTASPLSRLIFCRIESFRFFCQNFSLESILFARDFLHNKLRLLFEQRFGRNILFLCGSLDFSPKRTKTSVRNQFLHIFGQFFLR